MSSLRYWRSWILIAASLMSAVAGFSQTTATIVGAITDGTGAVVPGCSVKVTNEATGLTREVKTEADGNYVAPLLPPGAYSVEASAAGFKTTIRTGIPLSVQEAARVDLTELRDDLGREVRVELVFGVRGRRDPRIGGDHRRVDGLSLVGAATHPGATIASETRRRTRSARDTRELQPRNMAAGVPPANCVWSDVWLIP